ncbi:MAG: DUF1326 domain-containing protein [Rhodospirillaceae bacterium]|nr:DUF1326 domain-containing protein [Rhodospirillaceae bacterium]MBT5037475.1 DUF1326 domain-containing protein [Rhodospirillaceae bacterium]MBT5675585.1 DUF1326 domain-containing protein [Rhodospirillaceae bacterium]MBT5778604.1 DUF1326 domain-containing protein [Rhodospirillaceae bacterium]MBT7291840.1 DUF1326 domain-containing protein [Rhodospirillaceae bacterium]
MAYVDWKLKTKTIGTCSCDYGCPCEALAPPTRTPCEGVMAMEIVEGYFGDVRLDGLRTAGVYRWPGAVHEGGGTWGSIIDKSASAAQVAALFKIMGGEEQEPTTGFAIYGSTIEHELDPIFADIEFEWDLKGRKGRFSVSGILAADIEPIRNPVTGEPHFMSINLPNGFEHREAEMASATFWSKGNVVQEHSKRFATIFYASYGPNGIIEEETQPRGSI